MKSVKYPGPEVNSIVCIIIIMVLYKGQGRVIGDITRYHSILSYCRAVRSRVELLSECAGIGMSSAMVGISRM